MNVFLSSRYLKSQVNEMFERFYQLNMLLNSAEFWLA